MCTALTFLTFAIYGSAILRYRWVRYMAGVIIPMDIVAIFLGQLPKNAAGGALVYVIAVAFTIALRPTMGSGWKAAWLFSTLGIVIALTLEVRSLIIYSVLFFITFSCAARLRKRTYWLAGIVISSSVILTTVWFFLNIDSVPIAAEVARRITEMSGERANSGRNFLWPDLLRAVGDDPMFGLGAGILPHDILSTDLSAHNYYIQVYLQLGLVGLAIVVAFLLSVWWLLSNANTAAGRFGSAVFIIFVVHNGTEVLMFQNQTLIGLPAWCAIGIALAIERNPEFLRPTASPAKTNPGWD
jgi:O-antigen ligase